MILTRERYLESIKERLALLQKNVKLENASLRFDLNRASEDFYANFLNLVYNYSLSNGNHVAKNLAAIDLVDEKNRIAVQITSNASYQKVKHTLRMFNSKYYKGKPYKDSFDRLIIFIITEKESLKRVYKNLPDTGIEFDPKVDIWDNSDIIATISSMDYPISNLKAIAEFLEENITFQNSVVNVGNSNSSIVIQGNLECTICEAIRNSIISINRLKGCKEDEYVPLEAQVEESINGKPRRRNKNLLTYLKHSCWDSGRGLSWIKPNKKVYLVLGDSGSGKSFALRKLCLELLKTARISKRIPAYIDLGKWSGNWTAIKPPQMEDLHDFVKKTMMDEMRSIGQAIDLSKVFDEMLEKGRWFIVFDSFDEIPCLMGSGNNLQLRRKISELIHDYLTNEKLKGGIVASRYSKEPSDYLEANVRIEIREFDDIRIKTMLNKCLNNAFDVVDKLFREREDLVVLCRNPFYLSLLIGYIKGHGTEFPKKQIELYTQYLDSCIKNYDGTMNEFALSEDDVILEAKRLSVFMQQSSKFGLECPLKDYVAQFDVIEKRNKCLLFLKDIGLCHVDDLGETISFVHRRFQEYFLAESINEAEKSKESNIIYDFVKDIIYNSGRRDAIALYCEIADEDKTKEIARFCWKTINEKISSKANIDDDESIMILVNTLSFMVDAFRNNKMAIEDFYDEYEKFIIGNLDNDTHFIIQETLIKGALLFDPERESLTKLVLQTFNLGNTWLNDIIMENCRMLKKVEPDVETQFTSYFFRKPMRMFVKQFRNTDFALSKAIGFRYVRLIHFLHFVNILLVFVYIAHSLFTPSILRQWGFPIREMMEELDLGLSSFISISKLDKKSLTALIQDSRVIELFQLSLTVFILTKEKTRPKKVGEIYKHSTIETLFSGMLFMTPLYSVLFTRVMNNNSGASDYYKVFMTISVAILVVIIVINLPYAFHDIYYYYKDNSMGHKEICFQIIRPSAFFAILLLSTSCFVVLIPNLFVTTIGIVLATLFIIVIVFSSIASIIYIKKWYFMEHVSYLSEIDKKDLVNNLEKIFFIQLQIIYLNRLLDKHIYLKGEWPDRLMNAEGQRVKYQNDDIEVAISKLEYESMVKRNQP